MFCRQLESYNKAVSVLLNILTFVVIYLTVCRSAYLFIFLYVNLSVSNYALSLQVPITRREIKDRTFRDEGLLIKDRERIQPN